MDESNEKQELTDRTRQKTNRKMSNTSPSNESTRPPDSKVCSSGAPSNSITNVVASSSVETNLEEQIATQITGQSEPQSSSKDGKKEGEKKRPAAEINGSKQSEEPAKKVKTAAAQQGETAGVPATTSNIPGRMAGGDSLGGSQDLMTRRRRSTRSRRVPDVSYHRGESQFPVFLRLFILTIFIEPGKTRALHQARH